MRRIAANYIFPVTRPPLKNGIVELDNNGVVLNLIDTKGDFTESRNLEFYNGVLVPGFVNTHCHLELSELKNTFNRSLTLPGFITEIVKYKKKNVTEISRESAFLEDDLMKRNGIVAVGDIANTSLTIDVKQKSKLFYHTFVEVMGLNKNPEYNFSKGIDVYNQFLSAGLKSSVVPHAPYSVSPELFNRVKTFAVQNNSIQSIHNQESESENQFFESKTGKLVDAFMSMGIDLSGWNATGKHSLESINEFLPRENNFLFVHNLYSTKNELQDIIETFKNPFFVLCPNSNFFIGEKYPDFELFLKFKDKVALGTDSLASNTSLSILDEMKTITRINPAISFDTILQWATLNGAKALNCEKEFGSFETGKQPGINLISDFDFTKMQITEKSRIKVLV
ncbi:MAG: hypothetical protein A2X13_02830 [Bacteroidetes bacterium GWC2_33_15]|nr:MAG: hypothetical protein A2X10_05350 [Bacteroidetes bacterium GWA2_33_15]OFX49421.1 MAG: hypothetical protein A2X13_02830 [Bacteroidetes bacterium GWC2_33_15]OFX62986.1 MAG: hypothetical protein A2X15_10045 [Bacteroidetes bacterium GWB2_32_14]OFX68769.1 MAG: hypothetical protein A2X14_14355 [Bacteroidetes bacterium GWD2_33_33]HAN19056.1 hypothetical protein [Bacteroidales bacterium]